MEVAKEKPDPSTELQHYVTIRQTRTMVGEGPGSGVSPLLEEFFFIYPLLLPSDYL